MNRLTVYRANARGDLPEIAVFFVRTGLAASDRFLASVEDAAVQLRRMPGFGETGNPQFAGLRCWRVPKFKHYIIFYRPTELGIEILRVLHGARDMESLFGGADVTK